MKHLFPTILLASIALAGCQKAPNTQLQNSTETAETTAQAPETKKLGDKEVITTPSGGQFLGSKGWKMTQYSDHIALKSPEGSLSAKYYELPVSEYQTASKAIDEAFKRYSQDIPFKFKEGPVNEASNQMGYEIVAQKEYINLENMNVALNAVLKQGDTWYCFVTGGRQDALTKRAGEINLLVHSHKTAYQLAAEQQTDAFVASLKVKPFDANASTELDAFVTEAMKQFDLPGAAVVVVQDGKIVHSKGYGTRVYGQDLPVTEKTLFQIGSTSKTLTAYMAAEAIKQGKLTWDTPASQLLPAFQTGDPELSKQVTIKNLLGMASGLPRRDLSITFRLDTPEQMLKQMGKIKPVAAIGTGTLYSNHSVASAGYAIAHAMYPQDSLADAWRKTMQNLVFEPLGMTSATFDSAKAQTTDYAAPTAIDAIYKHYNAKVSRNDPYNIGYAPAGGLWLNAEDMGKFMLAELAIDPKDPIHSERWKGHTPDGLYGLGLFLENASGFKLRHHGGSLTGYQTQLYFLPEQNLGIAIMANSGIASIHGITFQKVINSVFGINTPKDIIQNMNQALTKMRQNAEAEFKNVEMTPDPKWLESLVGKYHDEELGDAEISIVNAKGFIKTTNWESEFGRLEKDGKTYLFLVQEHLPGLNYEVISKDGKVQRLSFIEDQGNVKYEYTLNKQ